MFESSRSDVGSHWVCLYPIKTNLSPKKLILNGHGGQPIEDKLQACKATRDWLYIMQVNHKNDLYPDIVNRDTLRRLVSREFACTFYID